MNVLMNEQTRPARRRTRLAAALVVPLAVAALSGCQHSTQGSAVPPAAPATSAPAAVVTPPTSASPAAVSASTAAAAAAGAKAAAANALSAAAKQASAAAGTVGSDLSGASAAPEGDPTQ